MRGMWSTAQNRIFVNILWYTVSKEGFLMAQFVDRELEIATLEKEYAKKKLLWSSFTAGGERRYFLVCVRRML